MAAQCDQDRGQGQGGIDRPLHQEEHRPKAAGQQTAAFAGGIFGQQRPSQDRAGKREQDIVPETGHDDIDFREQVDESPEALAADINVGRDRLILRKIIEIFSEKDRVIPHAVAFGPADAERVCTDILKLCEEDETGTEDQAARQQIGKPDFIFLIPKPGCEQDEGPAQKYPDPKSLVGFTEPDKVVKNAGNEADQYCSQPVQQRKSGFQFYKRAEPFPLLDQYRREDGSGQHDPADKDERRNDLPFA